MSDSAAEPTELSPSPGLALVIFGTLPVLAAFGPILTPFRGLFAFRVMSVFIIFHAFVFLMGRERWRSADVWLAWTTVSTIAAGLLGFGRITPDSEDPYSEFLAVSLGLLTALAARAWQRRVPGMYLLLARGWVAAGLVVCVITAGEVYTGVHLPGYLAGAEPAPAAMFGNPNALAIFVVMANVWAIPARRSSGSLWRASTWVLALASVPVLFFTGARLAMVTWLLVIAWSLWLGLRRSRHPLVGIAGALLPVGAAVTALVMLPLLLGYFTEIASSGSSGNVRNQLLKLGLSFAVEQRGLPTWPGAFESLMVQRGDPLSMAGLVNAHNTWVELLVQYGAISLLLLLGWLITCAFTRSGARDETALAAATLLVLGTVNSSSLGDASFWMFVITLAVASRTPAFAARDIPAREVVAL